MQPPWQGGKKVYINGPGHMTKMAAMPIYGKNLKKSSPIFTKLGMLNRGLLSIIAYINDDPGVTLVKFGNLGFSIGKVKTVDISETIEACDLKVGRYRHLIDFMKVCEY